MLNIQAEEYQRGERKVIGVIVECKECDVTIAIDYKPVINEEHKSKKSTTETRSR
jgi:hypothetical protein